MKDVEDVNIQFYGERGIVNGILLDINDDQAKLEKFFGAIKLLDGTPLPWKGPITECKWLVEPCLAQFGDPDFIAVFMSQGEKYVLFFEAKREGFEESSLKIDDNMKTRSEEVKKKYKGQTSKLNIQLWLRHRFVQAYLSQKGKITSINENYKYPDGQKRKLDKPIVIDLIHNLFKEVKKDNYYFIALTNDKDCNDPWKEINEKYHPPLVENEKKTSRYGLLTYASLEKRVIKNSKGFYGKAKEMMNLNTPGSLNAGEVEKITGMCFMDWGNARKEWAEKFISESGVKFNTLQGSYSGLVRGVVEMKLMADPKNKDKLMIGFRSEDGINIKLTKNIAENITPVQYCINGQKFFFYSFDRSQTTNMQNLALQYIDSFAR